MGLLKDIKAVKKRDPSARYAFEIVLTYPSIHALFWYRKANFLHRHHLKLLARFISALARFFTGIEIHPAAKIGDGVFIDHGMGVVIGETAVVGDNVTIYQGVTLGGTGKETGKRHPTIGNNVVIASGAKVLGPFSVGDNAKIGAGSVVLKEVPKNATVVGVPGEVVSGKKNSDEFDLVNLPDPVFDEIKRLNERISHLENKLNVKREEEETTDSLLL